jgi:hypothetical protein
MTGTKKVRKKEIATGGKCRRLKTTERDEIKRERERERACGSGAAKRLDDVRSQVSLS